LTVRERKRERERYIICEPSEETTNDMMYHLVCEHFDTALTYNVDVLFTCFYWMYVTVYVCTYIYIYRSLLCSLERASALASLAPQLGSSFKLHVALHPRDECEFSEVVPLERLVSEGSQSAPSVVCDGATTSSAATTTTNTM
jgi:hypothetical protein